MRKDDIVRLQHMLDAAREACSFVAGRKRTHLSIDRQLTLAIVKDIEIIGEAASRVSAEGRSACPGIPWQDCIAMRNRLIHGYFDIDLDIVWSTVKQELPPLIAELEQILAAGHLTSRQHPSDAGELPVC